MKRSCCTEKTGVGDIGKKILKEKKQLELNQDGKNRRWIIKINIKEKNKIDKIKIFVFKICVNWDLWN